MSFNVDNKNPAFNPSEIGLVAPKDIGKQYLDPVKRPLGPALGEGDNTIQGEKPTRTEEIFKDIIEQMNATDADLGPAVLGFNLATSLKGFEILAQEQIDKMDPSSPAIVFLPRFAQLYQEMLTNAGKMIGDEGALGESKLVISHKIAQGEMGEDIPGLKTDGQTDAQRAKAADAAAEATGAGSLTAAGTNPLANPWLGGTAYVAFLCNYWEMLKVLRQMKEVDGNIQIQGMNMMVEIAKNTAEAILKAAETRFWEHIAMAIVDGVTIGVTVAATAVSIGATFRMKAEVDTQVQTKQGTTKTISADQIKATNIKLQSIASASQAISQSATSAEKALDNIIQGTMELEAAKYDALREILQAFRQVMQMQADRAQEAFRQNSEMIAQLIQQIDAMRQKLLEAQAKALSRSSA